MRLVNLLHIVTESCHKWSPYNETYQFVAKPMYQNIIVAQRNLVLSQVKPIQWDYLFCCTKQYDLVTNEAQWSPVTIESHTMRLVSLLHKQSGLVTIEAHKMRLVSLLQSQCGHGSVTNETHTMRLVSLLHKVMESCHKWSPHNETNQFVVHSKVVLSQL